MPAIFFDISEHLGRTDVGHTRPCHGAPGYLVSGV
jgi:hypothetical protein